VGVSTWRMEKEGEKGGAGSIAGPSGQDGSGQRCRRRQCALVVGVGSQTGEGGAVRAGRGDGVQVRPTGGIGARRGSVDSGRGVREKEREAGWWWCADMRARAARFKLDLYRFKI
jgi:hypothetical protein